MKAKIILLGSILAALVLAAQTNEPVVQVKFFSDANATNKITFLEKGPFRTIWLVVEGTFPKSGRILAAKILFDEFGRMTGETGDELVVANYPAAEILTIGRKISLDARKIGTIRGLKSDGADSSTVLELWEYYTPTPEEIAAAIAAQEKAKAAQEKAIADAKAKAAAQKQAAAARALKYNQDDAAKGDAYGLMRMGERYRDGDGVEKDLAKAKEYLQKAADAGSPTAAEELSKLKP
jgi:hypothetical protein